MNRLFLALYFFLTSIVVWGQQGSWTLQQCLDEGLKNNRDIKIQKLEVARAVKSHEPGVATLLPTVGLNASQSYNFGSTIDPATNGRVSSDILYDRFYLSSSASLLDFNNLAKSSVNRVSVDLAKADEAVLEYEYKLTLLEKYFDALYTQELVAIQQEQLDNTQFNLTRVTDEFNLGRRPKSDLYDMQLSYQQEVKSVTETKQLLKTQLLQLFQLMNIDEVPKAVVLASPSVILGVEDAAVTNNPKMQQKEVAYERSLKNVQLQRAALLPSVDAYYSFSTFYYKPLTAMAGSTVESFSSQIDFNKNHEVGFQLSIPVFNGFRNRRNINVAKIETEQKKIATEDQKIKLQQEIDLESTRKEQYTTLQESLDQTLTYAGKSYVTSEAKFESNQIEAVTFTAVKNQLLSAKYDCLKNTLLLKYSALKLNLMRYNNF